MAVSKKQRMKLLSKLVSDEEIDKVVKAVENYMVDKRKIESVKVSEK